VNKIQLELDSITVRISMDWSSVNQTTYWNDGFCSLQR